MNLRVYSILTRDDEASTWALLVLDRLDSDVERARTIPICLVSQSRKTEFLNGIVGIGNQLSEKDVSIGPSVSIQTI